MHVFVGRPWMVRHDAPCDLMSSPARRQEMNIAIIRSARIAVIVVFVTAGCSMNCQEPKQSARREAETLYRDGTQLLKSNPAMAIELLTQSLKLNPDAPPALYNRACAYASVGRDNEAIADMQRLEVAAPEVGKQLRNEMKLAAAPYTSLAEEDYKAKNFASAIQKCDSALAYNPEWGDAWVIKGLSFQALGDTTKALESFDKGAEIEPDNFYLFINRAELHLQEDRFEQALSDFTKAIVLRPNEADGYQGRSDVYAALKMSDKAANDRTRAEELRAKERSRKPIGS
jgi:tetratricopeptide (TPR) repeat protein